MAKRILLAEDDQHIREGLCDTLEIEGYEVAAAADGDEAINCFRASHPDLVILDIMMPKINGYEVCKLIRAEDRTVPIIMLTAKGEEIDKVLGLELGADDYITKPFGIRELIARISAVLRRAGSRTQPEMPDEFLFGNARINRRAFKGMLGEAEFKISKREMELIKAFHQHPGEVLSRDELLQMAWDVDYGSYTRTLDQHVAQLRKKIEPDAQSPCTITTVHGVGYRYEGEDE